MPIKISERALLNAYLETVGNLEAMGRAFGCTSITIKGKLKAAGIFEMRMECMYAERKARILARMEAMRRAGAQPPRDEMDAFAGRAYATHVQMKQAAKRTRIKVSPGPPERFIHKIAKLLPDRVSP